MEVTLCLTRQRCNRLLVPMLAVWGEQLPQEDHGAELRERPIRVQHLLLSRAPRVKKRSRERVVQAGVGFVVDPHFVILQCLSTTYSSRAVTVHPYSFL